MRLNVASVIGVLEGLLVARLVSLLFAARPDHPAFAILWAITAPLVWPWSFIDRWMGQPRSGARLELATVGAMAMLAVAGVGWAWYRGRGTDRRERDD